MKVKSGLLILSALLACVVVGRAQSIGNNDMLDVETVIHVGDSLIYQLDSALVYVQGDNDTLELVSRKVLTYNEDNNVDAIRWYDLNSESWTNQKKEKYIYNTVGISWVREEMQWDTELSEWKSVKRRSYTLNSNSKEIDILYSEANDQGEWVNVWKQAQNYNSDGKLLSYQTVRWNSELNTWQSYWDYYRYYDDEGNLLQISHKEFDTETNLWVDKWECINEYELNQLESEMILDWDMAGEQWGNLKKTNVTHPQSNRVVKEVENWDSIDDDWRKSIRTIEITDSTQGQEEIVTEQWNESSQAWVSNSKNIVNYNELGLKKVEQSQYWDESSLNWDNSYRVEYYYSEQKSDVSDEFVGGNYFFIYPNPADSYIQLKYKGEAERLQIYNIKGVLVKVVEDPQADEVILVNDLKKGVYVAVLDINDVQFRAKFVKK